MLELAHLVCIQIFILIGWRLLACASSAFTEGLIYVQTLRLAELNDHNGVG